MGIKPYPSNYALDFFNKCALFLLLCLIGRLLFSSLAVDGEMAALKPVIAKGELNLKVSWVLFTLNMNHTKLVRPNNMLIRSLAAQTTVVVQPFFTSVCSINLETGTYFGGMSDW